MTHPSPEGQALNILCTFRNQGSVSSSRHTAKTEECRVRHVHNDTGGAARPRVRCHDHIAQHTRADFSARSADARNRVFSLRGSLLNVGHYGNPPRGRGGGGGQPIRLKIVELVELSSTFLVRTR